MAKVAVGSSDGINIDEHFGRAGQFLIYEIDGNEDFRLLETRKSNLDAEGHNKARLDSLARLLADVDAVLVYRIGPKGAETLRRAGIVSVALGGRIDRALAAYAKRGKLLGSPLEPSISISAAEVDLRASCPIRQRKLLLAAFDPKQS